jgi:sulfide:quinone oxidoreductase
MTGGTASTHGDMNSAPRFNVVVAGGGVAALEATLALRDLGHGQIATTILAPDQDFVDRPMAIREPFGYTVAKRYPLQQIAQDVGARYYCDKIRWLDPGNRIVHTEAGAELHYDALLLALGAVPYTRYKHSLTLDHRRLDEQLHGLIQDVEGGYLQKLAFIIPDGAAWPLPIYELALMIAARAQEMYASLSITIATPEDAPLAIFGRAISDRVGQLLDESGIVRICSAHCEVPEAGHVAINPGPRRLIVDRVITLPELFGPGAAGVPRGPRGGFIPVDAHGKVHGLDHVYAAGDATNYPIKFGGIAAQQADTAAQAIAAAAGLAAEPGPFQPLIEAVLLTGGRPLLLSARVTGQHGSSLQITEAPNSTPPAKIVARYLTPYLHGLDHDGWRAVESATAS